ncbi:unnamed protein product [Ceratitis capitata]|uniref:(Mediterranean fruit fly) hypothetical protein n=1 Tax=Ceratitis capitata TaxID=7213 RepID=A0A811V3T8_CERCA|nr:unnamed protein product [Ceratitis capitata]
MAIKVNSAACYKRWSSCERRQICNETPNKRKASHKQLTTKQSVRQDRQRDKGAEEQTGGQSTVRPTKATKRPNASRKYELLMRKRQLDIRKLFTCACVCAKAYTTGIRAQKCSKNVSKRVQVCTYIHIYIYKYV